MCYVGIRLLETFHLLGKQMKSHYDVIRHAEMPPRSFNNNNLSRKHPLGNDYIGEGDVGTGASLSVVAMPNIITLLNSHLLLLHAYKILSPIPA